MNTPDLTRAQLLALAQAVIGAAVAFGAPISGSQSTALLALVGTFSVVLVAADAAIRGARAKHVAGPILDRAAAEAIRAAAAAHDPAPEPRKLRAAELDLDAIRARAAATPDPISAARDRLRAEADADAEAQAANELGAPSSVDQGPATPPEPAGPSPGTDEPEPGVDPATL